MPGQIRLVEFQIRLGIKYWSNWVEIHCEYIVCLPGRIGYHPNEFNWHLSQWIYTQFDWSNLTGVTVKNIPTHEIIPQVYFHIRYSVKNILGVYFC